MADTKMRLGSEKARLRDPAPLYGRAMPYGRLADPDSTLGTDPRSDPRMVKVLAQFGLDGSAPVEAPPIDSALEDRLAWAVEVDGGRGRERRQAGRGERDVPGGLGAALDGVTMRIGMHMCLD